MEGEIYLDNCSTTKVCGRAKKKFLEIIDYKYGNSSSLHTKGIEAENEIEKARVSLAKKLNCLPDEICFTSGATESNNLALLGTAYAKRKLGNRIIISAIEHPSVLNVALELKNRGFEVIELMPSREGIIKEQDIFDAVNSNTILISIMMVNNETGAIEPIDCIKNIIEMKKINATIHTDAAQAFCKIPINVNEIGVDLLSLSGHKTHAVKGIGALYIKKGTRIIEQTFGGGQQNNLRSGTCPTELIACFGEAVEDITNIEEEYNKVKKLQEYAKDKLACIKDITINSPINSSPYILNISVKNLKSETLMHYLAMNKVYVSSGSACAKIKKSYVLKAMGISDEKIDSSIRISFSRYSTQKDVDELINGLNNALNTLLF